MNNSTLDVWKHGPTWGPSREEPADLPPARRPRSTASGHGLRVPQPPVPQFSSGARPGETQRLSDAAHSHPGYAEQRRVPSWPLFGCRDHLRIC